jgi:hypothetical protein
VIKSRWARDVAWMGEVRDDNLDDVCIDGKVMLEWILEK